MADQWEICKVNEYWILFISPKEVISFRTKEFIKNHPDHICYILSEGWEPIEKIGDYGYLFRRKYQG